MARLVVSGRTSLYRELRRPGHATDLQEAVRERTAAWTPFVSLACLDFAIRPSLDLDALRSATDFLGELLKAADDLTGEECLSVWASLLDDKKFNRFELRSVIETLDWREATLQAQYLCADLLSAGDPE